MPKETPSTPESEPSAELPPSELPTTGPAATVPATTKPVPGNHEPLFEDVVFLDDVINEGKPSETHVYKSRSLDRKIIILTDSSITPEPGKSYQVRVIEDTEPTDPKKGKLIVEIVLDPEEHKQQLANLVHEVKASFDANDFQTTVEKLRALKKAAGIKETRPEHKEIEWSYERLEKEFDYQVYTLISKKYPEASGLTGAEFLDHIEPLREQLRELAGREFKEGHIPFVIVVKDELVAPEKKIEQAGITVSLDPEMVKNTDEGIIPKSVTYLIVDVETGKAMPHQSPNDAIRQLKKEGRSPLTAEEGIALFTQHPELIKGHGMHLVGSVGVGNNIPSIDYTQTEPWFLWANADHIIPKYGTASCGERMG